ncbi:hypothetical protein BaRGS_00030505 [Batillaria attramentaria]|uniref:Uncharacterized protein n=1 Tax=Batillaria attramentaria TaxID=370345 RepID=A0ABD0JUE3_9CAEN
MYSRHISHHTEQEFQWHQSYLQQTKHTEQRSKLKADLRTTLQTQSRPQNNAPNSKQTSEQRSKLKADLRTTLQTQSRPQNNASNSKQTSEQRSKLKADLRTTLQTQSRPQNNAPNSKQTSEQRSKLKADLAPIIAQSICTTRHKLKTGKYCRCHCRKHTGTKCII